MDAEPSTPRPDRNAVLLHVADRAAAGGQHLVAARAVGDGGSCPAEPCDFAFVEMNAVRQPGPLAKPAAILQIVERAAAVEFVAVAVLVLGLGEMRVQPDLQLRGELGRRLHQRCRHREWRAWRERDLNHRIVAALMVPVDQPLAVGKDSVFVLHHAVRREPAVALRQVHRAAGEDRADAEPPGYRNLDVDGVFEAGREHVVVIGGRGAAGQQQLRHRGGHGKLQRLRGEPSPDRIERLEPGKQLAVERRGQRPRQRLVEMMVRVDQARNDHVGAGVEHRSAWRRGCAARGHQLGDAAVLDHDAAFGVVRENRQRVLDPDCRLAAHRRLPDGSRICKERVSGGDGESWI